MHGRHLLLFLAISSVVVVSTMKISGGTNNQHQILRCTSYLRYPTLSAININAIRRRHQPSCAASTSDIDGSYNNNSSVSSIASIRYPRRCSSKDAAAIIQNRSMDGLLIITCDASGRGVSMMMIVLYSAFIDHWVIFILSDTYMLLLQTGWFETWWNCINTTYSTRSIALATTCNNQYYNTIYKRGWEGRFDRCDCT